MKTLFNSENKWGLIAKLLHWVVAIVVIAMFVMGLWMEDLNYDHIWYHKAPFIHKSVGILLFFVIIFRIIWRLINKTPKPPATHSKAEKILAKLMHFGIYVILLSVIVAGYMMSTSRGHSVSVFDWFEIPALFTPFEDQGKIAGALHYYIAILLISMVVLHALAAIKHHFINKDDTLKRMIK